jgi:hypothetical protein
MVSRCFPWLRTIGAVVAILATVPGLVAGCSTSPPPPPTAAISGTTTAPEVAAARELAVSDLLPAFEWADPATVPPVPVVAPTTTEPTTTAPATTEPTTTAPATTAVIGDPRGLEAMALIAFSWRRTLPGWSIEFLPAQAGLRGLTRVDGRRIEIYLRDGDSPESSARVVAHELGHAVDVELNSAADRERWRAVRGVAPSVPWWPANAVSDFDTLAGDFAEAFATMLTGSVSLSRVAPPPGPAELAVLAELAAR